MENNQCMLTTFDNPFDPFEDFSLWYLYDLAKGYNTCSYLARITKLSEDMSQEEEDNEVERAIDEILEKNPSGLYKKKFRKNAVATA